MRRILLAEVKTGHVHLEPREAHHVRNVLRLKEGETVEVFDATGRSADAVIVRATETEVVVQVSQVRPVAAAGFKWTVAAAVPKGSRADWMIEKLGELGTALFVPLAAERSVVLPEGEGKRQRWIRIAAEAAKQSRRQGVMAIDTLTSVNDFLQRLDGPAWYLTTDATDNVADATKQIAQPHPASKNALSLLIGPEGGWTQAELAMFQKAALTGVSLGGTILRVETAAVAAAVIAAAIVAPAVNRGVV